MADSLSNRASIVIHAIAATVALSLIASHLQSKPSPTPQATLIVPVYQR